MTRLFSLLLLALAIPAAHSQTYPSRPIALVVPYTPGTGIDIIARTVGIVMKWNRELEQILALPDVRETFTRQGMVPAHSSPEDLTRQIAADVQRWKKFIAETGIKAD